MSFESIFSRSRSMVMEESTKELKLGRVFFPPQHRLPSSTSRRQEKMDSSRALEHLNKEKPSSSSCYHSLEIPDSPHEAMEFLSRSWSPSASNFFQILSSESLQLPLHEEGNWIERQNHDETAEIEGTERATTQCDKDTVKRVGSIWKWLATGRTLFWVLQKHTSPQNSWMNMRYLKGWLRGKSLLSFAKEPRDKKKEGIRLQTAKVHAALSVAQLAAAVAGVAAFSGSFEFQDMNGMATGDGSWNQSMGAVVASAAALVATVCAEAAESAGAQRAHVADVVNSGLATKTSSDMITLTATATAATCLRGTATLESRVKSDPYFSKELEMLARGTQLLICTPSGHKRLRIVCIYLKHNILILRSGKKHLRGFLTSSKEYKIINVIKETKEAQGFHSIRLIASVDKIDLFFQDEMQFYIWKSTISHLLQNQSSNSITDAATQGGNTWSPCWHSF